MHSWKALLPALAVFVAGCAAPDPSGDDSGPFQVRIFDYKMVDARNITFNVSFKNAGSTPISVVAASIGPRLIKFEGGAQYNGIGSGVARPAIDETHFPQKMQPGAYNNFSLTAHFPSRQSPEITEGHAIEIIVLGEVRDDRTWWMWTRYYCATPEGEPVVGLGFCGMEFSDWTD